MRIRSGLLAALALMLFGVSGAMGLAQAQPTTPKGQPAGTPTAGMQMQVNLSADEMNKQADEHLARIFANSKIVRKMHSDARDKKDVVKALCLDDKLSQLDVTYRTATERRNDLASALKRNDNELSSHQFTIVSELRRQAERLMGEANQCIGTDVDYTANSSVTPNIEQGIPDPTDVKPSAPSIPFIIPPPSCVSCAL
ncbi:MAG: hypothetical protein U0165_13805 [Polyangiaceae bacterium]